MHSARERAEKLAEVLRGTGATDRAIYQGELQDLHWEMCECLGWLPKGWPAVCRELAKLPGVKRGLLKINGQRLTAYEVAPAAESSTNVVSIGERREAS